MNTRNTIAMLLAGVLLAGCGGGSGVRQAQGPADRPMEKAAAVQPAADAPTLAIVKLMERGVSEGEAALVTDILRSELARTGKYRVVEREQIERMMQEKAIKMADMTSDSAEAGVARLLNAQLMGLGSFGKLMGNYVLSFRIIDVETGMTRGAGTAEGKDLEEVKKGIGRLAESL